MLNLGIILYYIIFIYIIYKLQLPTLTDMIFIVDI